MLYVPSCSAWGGGRRCRMLRRRSRVSRVGRWTCSFDPTASDRTHWAQCRRPISICRRYTALSSGATSRLASRIHYPDESGGLPAPEPQRLGFPLLWEANMSIVGTCESLGASNTRPGPTWTRRSASVAWARRRTGVACRDFETSGSGSLPSLPLLVNAG